MSVLQGVSTAALVEALKLAESLVEKQSTIAAEKHDAYNRAIDDLRGYVAERRLIAGELARRHGSQA